jgi:hypothetical protein
MICSLIRPNEKHAAQGSFFVKKGKAQRAADYLDETTASAVV